jgi:hypothetical protein
MSTELLEEKGDTGTHRRISKLAKPIELCQPTAWLTFPPGDDPVQPAEI